MIDLHLHPGMTDFLPVSRTYDEKVTRIKGFLAEYRKAGFTVIRDAGYFEPYSDLVIPGMVRCGAEMKDDSIPAPEPAPWVKIFATGGVGADPGKVLEPLMSRDAFMKAVALYHSKGIKVMVHCYGGESLDWAAEAGVDSVEHGVYMTREQAERLAEKDIPLVPTTSVYRLLAEKPDLFGLPEPLKAVFSENAKKAVLNQIRSVGYALAAGIRIGYGTDFYADPVLLPYAEYEFETLMDCGLSRQQAQDAAGSIAEQILGMDST